MSDLQATCPVCGEILVKVNQIVHDMERAFPDGAESHGKYHAEIMKSAEAQTKFWTDLSTDLKYRGIRSVILILFGYAVYKVFGSEAVRAILKFIA